MHLDPSKYISSCSGQGWLHGQDSHHICRRLDYFLPSMSWAQDFDDPVSGVGADTKGST